MATNQITLETHLGSFNCIEIHMMHCFVCTACTCTACYTAFTDGSARQTNLFTAVLEAL